MVAVFMSDRMIKWSGKRLRYGSVTIVKDSTFGSVPAAQQECARCI